MDLRKLLAALAPEHVFPTADEIDARIDRLTVAFPSTLTSDTIGHSRAGRPLRRLTVGSGDRRAVVIGMPHPNEPTGAVGALALAELLAADEELSAEVGFTWHIVPCADPDGSVLNQSWFAGPFTRESYSAGIFRPPLPEDFEWTFHRADLEEPGQPATPETRAVMTLLDSVRPDLLVSMHNSEAGGLYAYITDADTSIAEGLAQTSLLTGIPLDHGFPEAAEDALAPGMFHSEPLTAGGPMVSSTDYAAKHGTFGVVVEPPLWLVPNVADTSPTTVTAGRLYADLDREREQLRSEYTGWLAHLDVRRHLDTPRWRAVRSGTEHLEHRWEPTVDPEQMLTVAQISSVQRLRDLERLRLAGHVVAAIRDTPTLTPADELVLGLATSAVDRWAAESSGGVFCGLDASVAAHVGVALSAAEAVSTRG